MKRAKVRLFVDQPLGKEQSVALSREHAHYLFGVMRLGVGDRVALFNGANGEWQAEIVEAGKKRGVLSCVEQSAPMRMPPDLWLLFAPIKKARTDFIVEKAAEMGAARICPVQTEFTNSERIRRDRLQAHAVEAAEQCGGTFVPEVAEIARLDRPWAILIGPEGGFSDGERARLAGMEQAHAVSLGPRILRADTAAVAAMTVWQMALGDW